MIDTFKASAGVIALALVLFGWFWPANTGFGAANDEATTITNPWQFNNGGSIKLGSNGTAMAGIVTGSCTIWAGAQTITASSSVQAVCQSATNGTLASGLSGVTSDSICTVQMASSTNTTLLGIQVGGVSASSTAGSIVTQIKNLTGTTFTWNAAATSSAQWRYLCLDPL